MEFIDKKYQKNPIRTMHETALENCDEIWAAVAYVDNTQIHQNLFIDSCHKKNIPLKLYARYDYSIPVGMDILKWFLDKKSPNYSCRLVPNRLHSKIIWYRPYGIYVGSANLTSRAWIKNLEAGFFLTQVELEREKMLDDIKDYFDLIHEYSYDLTTEIYDKLLEYKDANSKELNKLQKKFADIPGLPPKDFIDAHQSRRESHQRKKEEFLKEWNNTLQDIRNIAERVAKDYQPDWINDDVPPGVLADQFLHAYYDNCKKEYKIPKVYYKLHEENNNDVEFHLVSAMEWWKKLPEAVFGVDRHIYDCAPKLRDYFSKKRICFIALVKSIPNTSLSSS